MADANASSDFLPQIPRERADSNMSLGGGFTLPENGEHHSNGAGPLAGDPAPATAAPPAAAPSGNEKMVEDVLSSEIGVATMLNRLKQSVASAKEFANFLKKRAAIEEDNANGLKRLARTTSDNMRRSDHLGGSFAKAFDGMMGTHSRIAENGTQYAMSLLQMAEDLNELAAIAEKQRKGWKQDGLAAEHRAADVDAQMRKSQAKYHSLAEEYDRVRTGDGQKGGKMFGFKGPKSAAQHEEELLRKVQAADQDYKNKVQAYQQERGQLISTTRPEAIRALQDIVRECDSGLVLQMQKFASFNEKLLLSNGLSVSPLKNGKSSRPDSMSLREIVHNVDTQRDLSEYLCANHSKVPPSRGEPKYERHPVLGVEGIYRLSGSLPQVNKMKSMFDTDTASPQLDFRNPENFFHDVNSVAGLLKQFFRDLPDPLLTKEHYSGFIEAAKHDDEIVRRDSLHAIINSLPDPNYATLRAVALHLHRVMENSATNRMTSQNLAIVFGPTLMGGSAHGAISDSGFQAKVVDTILQNTYQIFDDD
ncbi:hypothetical protein INS49_001441 [Diaporthe citri]|uniref:uncharacterized protein n=1 Tax=Diaporthe citri TaxID=83186 RepID=UPI001C7F0FE9|nr:uncharacterized protein INS49_001441 [Diaporthe citri]KAG6367254.1 hypothetical protein INS49_001441 [Diaporthe citri]